MQVSGATVVIRLLCKTFLSLNLFGLAIPAPSRLVVNVHHQGGFGKRPEVYSHGGGSGANGLGQLHGVAYRVRGSLLPGGTTGE